MTDKIAPEAIFIPMPKRQPDLPALGTITIDDIANPRPVETVGRIADQAGFSAPLEFARDQGQIGCVVKAPGTGFFLPPAYAQFAPALRQAIEHFYSQHSDDGYCGIGLFHGIVKPDPKDPRPYIDAHLDFKPEDDEASIAADGKAGQITLPNHRTYIVSDAPGITTGLTDQKIPHDALTNIRTREELGRVSAEILNRVDVAYKGPEPYVQIVWDGTTPHAFGNPQTPTFRTAFAVVFNNAQFKPPADLQNEWLEKEIMRLGGTPTENMPRPNSAQSPVAKGTGLG